MRPSIYISKERAVSELHIRDVQLAADSAKDEFGFLPASAYDEFAAKERIFIATIDGKYAGHLAFGGVYPRLKIEQLFVNADHRGSGVGKRLFSSLKEYATAHSWRSIYARVAAELPANHFWENVGLARVRDVQGGASRGRKIHLRELLLGTPDLFDALARPIRQTSVTEISLASGPISRTPTYAVDLNFLLDALKPARGYAEDAYCVLQAAHKGHFKVVITDEARVEISRTSSLLHNDPLLALIKGIPALPSGTKNRDGIGALITRYARPSEQNTPQLLSDILQLASCSAFALNGFITRDSTILRSRDELLRNFSLDAVTPSDLIDRFDDVGIAFLPTSIDATGKLEIRRIKQAELSEAADAVSKSVSDAWAGQFRSAMSTSGAIAIAAWHRQSIVAVAWQESYGPANGHASWVFALDDAQMDWGSILDQFLARSISLCAGLARVVLEISVPRITANIAEALRNRGCVQKPTESGVGKYKRLTARGFLQAQDWHEHARWISDALGLRIDIAGKSKRSRSEVVRCTDFASNPVRLTWFDLETLTSPVLYLFLSKTGLVISIRKEFSSDLLDRRQFDLLPRQEARMRTERAYFRHPQQRTDIEIGSPIIFYESGKNDGEGAAIGCARLTYIGIHTIQDSLERFRSQGVLERGTLEGLAVNNRVEVITFDNIQPLPRPVPHHLMNELGAIGPLNLQKPEIIPIDAVAGVLAKGFSND